MKRTGRRRVGRQAVLDLPATGACPRFLVLGFACMALVCSPSCSSKSPSTEAPLTAEDERLLERVIEEREGKVSWAAAGVPMMDQLMPETSLKERWPLYPDVESLAEKYGLQGLARALIDHQRPEFRRLGICLAAYHRLIGLGPDLIRLLKQDDTSPAEKEEVLTCLAQTGVSLESVLSSLEEGPLRIQAVGAYGNSLGLLSVPLKNMVLSSMDALLKDAKQGTAVRQVAWRILVAARRDGQMWYGDEPALSMARGLELSEEQEVAGWGWRLRAILHAQGVAQARNVAFAAEQVERFLASENKRVRLASACALLQTAHGQPKALPVLVGLVPEFDEPLPLWGSIGYRAIRALAIPEQGALLRDALAGLPSDEQQTLMRLVGREEVPSPDDMVRATIAFLGPDSKANTTAKVHVAQIVASALSRELARRSSP